MRLSPNASPMSEIAPRSHEGPLDQGCERGEAAPNCEIEAGEHGRRREDPALLAPAAREFPIEQDHGRGGRQHHRDHHDEPHDEGFDEIGGRRGGRRHRPALHLHVLHAHRGHRFVPARHRDVVAPEPEAGERDQQRQTAAHDPPVAKKRALKRQVGHGAGRASTRRRSSSCAGRRRGNASWRASA